LAWRERLHDVLLNDAFGTMELRLVSSFVYGQEARGREYEAKAKWWERWVQWSFVAAIACFLFSSLGLALDLIGSM
jgi:hypothetical protein